MKFLPLYSFHSMVNMCFNMMGYNIDRSCKLFSSVEMIGGLDIIIDKSTFIGHRTLLMGGENSSIAIGANCDISASVIIITGTHEIDMKNKRSAGRSYSSSITIGNGVWIGFGAKILPGVSIGDNAVIGAGSIVNKDIEPFTVVAGNPARLIRKIELQ